jgi:dihydroorotase
MALLIRGGRVIDPANRVDAVLDVVIERGKVVQVGREAGRKVLGPGGKAGEGVEVVEAEGLAVCPGFIDLHVHLREPGQEYKETIATGTRAAARGGFASVCCMPNTEPPNDTRAVTDYILERAERDGLVNVFPVGCITRGRKGEELAEIGELVEAGCVGLSDDGSPVMDSLVMRRAMEYASMFHIPVMPHCEDAALSHGGVVHEGRVATELGLRGIPSAAEAAMVARDLLLAELTGCPLHILHVSAADSVRLIREAKARGVRVTCEATPHHFTLTEEAVRGFRVAAKMNPPLRSAEDRQAIRDGLADGTIDAIATDHAPHALVDTEVEFDYAAFGIVGLETAVGLVLTELVGQGLLSLSDALAKLTVNPARILRLPGKGHLGVGAEADLTLLDLGRAWEVDPAAFASKGRNSPFPGWRLTGKPVGTIVDGRVAWWEGATPSSRPAAEGGARA